MVNDVFVECTSIPRPPIGLHTLYVGLIYMYACLRTLYRFNGLLEISVALVPCVLAAMPSNNL